MKNKFIAIFLVYNCLAFGQVSNVGIDTAVPKSLFHIDGKKDNPKTNSENPNSTQVANDVVISDQGNLGIGTITPTTKLEIVSPNPGAIKIVDGTEAESKVLMSDANGVATWQSLNSLKSVVPGVFPAASIFVTGDGISSSFGKVKYSNTYVPLTPGRWIVNVGLTIRSIEEWKSRFWMHAYLSTSQTQIAHDGFSHEGPAGNNTSFAGVIFGNPSNLGNSYTSNGTNMLIGSSIITVTKNTQLYLLLDDANSLPKENGEKVGRYTFDTASWENYFYAIPIE